MKEDFHPTDYKPAIIFATTQRCNYRCMMCPWSDPEKRKELNKKDPTMSIELFRRVLEEVMPYCSFISLTSNGEFLMDPFLEERLSILGEVLQKHPDVRLFTITNASLLTADRLSHLKGLHKAGFTISIESTDALTYASVRRPGILSPVMKNIRSLRSTLSKIGIDDVQLQINAVMMKSTIFSLPGLLHLAKDVNAILFVDHCQGYGNKALDKESLFNYPVFTNLFFNKCRKLAESLNVPFNCPPSFAVSPEEVKAYHDARSNKDKGHFCSQLSRTGPIHILSDGNVIACCQTLVLGNVNESSFKELFFSPKFPYYRQAIAEGRPLPPCDHCRWLERSNPYLYDSSDYDVNVPPESRNPDPDPDFEKEGFFDWLDTMSEEQMRRHLRDDYSTRARHLHSSGIEEEIEAIQRDQRFKTTIAGLIKQNASVIIYPAGRLTAWLLKNTFISELNILGISDKSVSRPEGLFEGYRLFPPEMIPTLKPDAVLVTSNLFTDQICRELSYLEKEHIRIVPFSG